MSFVKPSKLSPTSTSLTAMSFDGLYESLVCAALQDRVHPSALLGQHLILPHFPQWEERVETLCPQPTGMSGEKGSDRPLGNRKISKDLCFQLSGQIKEGGRLRKPVVMIRVLSSHFVIKDWICILQKNSLFLSVDDRFIPIAIITHLFTNA